MRYVDGIYYMNAEEMKKVWPLIANGRVVMPKSPSRQWTCESEGAGLRFPITGDKYLMGAEGASLFRADMAKYGITVEGEKGDGERRCRDCEASEEIAAAERQPRLADHDRLYGPWASLLIEIEAGNV